MVNFFNTKVNNNNKIEDAANTVLAPVRLLWRGKTVDVNPHQSADVSNQNQPPRPRESFLQLERSCWKKGLAVLSLPVIVPLGVILKGISRIPKDVRVSNKIAALYVQKLIQEQNALASFTTERANPADKRELPQLEEARYPEELMETAIVKAMQELLDEKVITPNEADNPSEDLWKAVCDLAVLNLLSKAEVRNDCMGDYIELNKHVSVRDGKAQEFYVEGDGNRIPREIFHQDALSTLAEGTNPVKTRQLLSNKNIKKLKKEIYISLNSAPAAQKQQQELMGHIAKMGDQVHSRYCNFEMHLVDGQVRSFPPKGTIDSEFSRATNVYEIMEIALRNVTRKLLDEGIAEDTDCPGIPLLAIFEVLELSELKEQETSDILKLSEHVAVEFHKPLTLFYGREDEGASILFLPNDLSSQELDNAIVTDQAIRVKKIMSNLNEEGQQALRAILMNKDSLQSGNRSESEENKIFEQFSISAEVREEITTALDDLTRLKDLINKQYLFALGSKLSKEFDTELSQQEPLPQIPTQTIDQMPPIEKDYQATIRQGPLIEYLPKYLRKGIIERRESSKSLLNPITKNELPRLRNHVENRELIARQFSIFINGDHTGSCLYSAVAQGLYEKTPTDANRRNKFGIDVTKSHAKRILGLRKAVANYIKGNVEEFLPLIYLENEPTSKNPLAQKQNNWNAVTDDSEEGKRNAVIARAKKIEHFDLTLASWATDTDVGILSQIFRRPIFIINEDSDLTLDERGKIKPTTKFGEDLEGEPIYLVLSRGGGHFELALPRF